jgi:uncharacterized YccA/Bax inhibitor family protein
MDVIEGLFRVVVLLLHWRIVVCLVASALGAYALVLLLPWLTGLQGVVIAALGLIPGVIWQAAYETNGRDAESQITTPFVAGLSAFFVGVIWGLASSASLYSAVAGALILALALLAWHRHSLVRQASKQPCRAIGCGMIAIVSYALVVTVNLYVL